jgi:hypothetical protein
VKRWSIIAEKEKGNRSTAKIKGPSSTLVEVISHVSLLYHNFSVHFISRYLCCNLPYYTYVPNFHLNLPLNLCLGVF